jgi:ergothioneine biosynthesis protein EgtB
LRIFSKEEMLDRFNVVRQASLDMVKPLLPEEFRMQVMGDASPAWWNLGHTTWISDRILHEIGARASRWLETYKQPLNSYYMGEKLARDQRGSVTWPSTLNVLDYRVCVDELVRKQIPTIPDAQWPEFSRYLELALQHEQQHQELFYTETKYLRFQNQPKYRQSYRDVPALLHSSGAPPSWFTIPGGLTEIGNAGDGFGWDIEYGIHQRYLEAFQISSRHVTVGEYLHFEEDGGYADESLWKSNGWKWIQSTHIQAPEYWECQYGTWKNWTLAGMRPLWCSEPVCHVSFYEADAYVRWLSRKGDEYAGVRLPTEFEWESASHCIGDSFAKANFLDSGLLHPRAATSEIVLAGEVWSWTTSHFEPYPRYEEYKGFLSEYNGKFMDNQRVLRGGSCVTERTSVSSSTRNFWPPTTRFQFSGIVLVRS